MFFVFSLAMCSQWFKIEASANTLESSYLLKETKNKLSSECLIQKVTEKIHESSIASRGSGVTTMEAVLLHWLHQWRFYMKRNMKKPQKHGGGELPFFGT